jgi:hypothetical protein
MNAFHYQPKYRPKDKFSKNHPIGLLGFGVRGLEFGVRKGVFWAYRRVGVQVILNSESFLLFAKCAGNAAHLTFVHI